MAAPYLDTVYEEYREYRIVSSLDTRRIISYRDVLVSYELWRAVLAWR